MVSPITMIANAARVVRILHGAILLGLVVVGAAFVALLRLRAGPALGQAKGLSPIMAAVGAVLLVLALAVLRPRIPSRLPEQSPDDFWSDANTRGLAVLLWAALEGSGMVGAVGYLLTGGAAPAVVAVVAIAALLSVRPSRLDSL